MTVITATLIIILVAMFLAFLIRLYSIKKGISIPRSLSSQLINIFGLIPRGIVRELKKVLNSGLKHEERLKALINVTLVALFLIVAIVGSMVLLVYTPFGGPMCVRCAFKLCALGFISAVVVADISIHKVF